MLVIILKAIFLAVLNRAELHQYAELFFDETVLGLKPESEEFMTASHEAFYKNLIDLFTIDRKELFNLPGCESFMNNFSTKTGSTVNRKFTSIGSYNITTSNPLIELDENRFLIPIPFILSEAVYESPFYWMMSDASYINCCTKNRGNVAEDIVFQYLSNVFQANARRRVLVKSSKGRADTDIDILCVLGSKALCVQVKSQKLTELSRKGDNSSLYKDFKRAVQDAYDQAWIARQKILDRSSKFFDEHSSEINLSEGIDEVYMVIVTTENFPSLTHQTHTMIQRKGDSPYPLALTVFDLELVAHYLPDPYDFLYYIRQRINLFDYFRGGEEMAYLGYHLTTKLWRYPNADLVTLDNRYSQIVDRNYFPFKLGINVSDTGDSIKNAWKDQRFELLCAYIKKIKVDKITDIIFHLYDLPGQARTTIVDRMLETKEKTLLDGQCHSVAIPPDEDNEPRFGLTYFSSENDSLEESQKKLLVLCNLRKYKSHADFWLGFASIKNSRNPFDCLIYNNTPWKYDEVLEEQAKYLPEPKIYSSPPLHKVCRNEMCPCGSGKKFKKCCLNN